MIDNAFGLAWRQMAVAIALGGFSPGAIAAEPIEASSADTQSLQEAPRPIKRGKRLFYPPQALSAEVAGDVELSLEITPEGVPTKISPTAETPPGYDFAANAIRHVETWQFAAGKPGRYSVTIKFRIENVVRVVLDSSVNAAPPPTRRLPPVYPPAARQRNREGHVTILVTLEKGEVTGVGVGRPPGDKPDDDSALFGDPAALAVLKWQFPETATGLFAVPVIFSLDELAQGRLKRHRSDHSNK